jgi:SAM-dependent methyltransferase
VPPRKPPLQIQPTTLWDYPSQHYGERQQGSARYVGATPSYVIWNLLQRYTRPGDLVIDPFCGSGTTLDVAKDLGRPARGFDVAPFRPDIEPADARALPLPDESVDFVFMDPPYADHIHYSDHPDCIGRMQPDEAYFAAIEAVVRETWRVLKDRRYFGFYVGDHYSKKHGFVPIGARSLAIIGQYFRLVDHVCVVRHNKSLKMGQWRRAAEEGNFFLRGFNHLVIAKKERGRAGVAEPPTKPRRSSRAGS